MNLFAAYKGNHLGKEIAPSVTAQEVNNRLEQMLAQHVHTKTKEGEAENGDVVNLDFEGFLDGVAFQGGKGEKYDLELGSHSFIPGFEEQLVSHKAGDDVQVNVTFPENYQAKELAGKAVVFKCKIHEVKTKIKMELNDEFAAHLGYKTLDELKEETKKDLSRQHQDELDRAYLEKLLRHLVNTSTIEVNAEQVDKAKNNVLSYYTNSVARYGLTLDAYLASIGMDKTQFEATLMEEAKNTAKTDVLTAYITEKEGLQASEDEINAQVALIKNYYHLDDDKVKEIIDSHKEELANDVTKQKVAEFLLNNND